jgi:hypothetical protein
MNRWCRDCCRSPWVQRLRHTLPSRCTFPLRCTHSHRCRRARRRGSHARHQRWKCRCRWCMGCHRQRWGECPAGTPPARCRSRHRCTHSRRCTRSRLTRGHASPRGWDYTNRWCRDCCRPPWGRHPPHRPPSRCTSPGRCTRSRRCTRTQQRSGCEQPRWQRCKSPRYTGFRRRR